jgi:hypothetical protein
VVAELRARVGDGLGEEAAEDREHLFLFFGGCDGCYYWLNWTGVSIRLIVTQERGSTRIKMGRIAPAAAQPAVWTERKWGLKLGIRPDTSIRDTSRMSVGVVMGPGCGVRLSGHGQCLLGLHR